jgi:hypothetical protein
MGLLGSLTPLEKYLCEHLEVVDLRNKVISLAAYLALPHKFYPIYQGKSISQHIKIYKIIHQHVSVECKCKAK